MRYAAKLLSKSDLTLFEAFFRANPDSKQKGINLNGNVLAELYTTLPRELIGTTEVPVNLDIYGPRGAPLQRVRRKIIKPMGGKNWRLNGKLIEEPAGEAGRYGHLAEHDVALFGFDGGDKPHTIVLVLASNADPEGAPLADLLRRTLDLQPKQRSMRTLTVGELREIAEASAEGSPVRLLLPDPDRELELEQAAEGNDEAARRLRKRSRSGATRPVSAAELESARVRATETGRAGETLFNAHLETRKTASELERFVWSADLNAVSPFDFQIITGGREQYIDVKTTTGKFSGPFHISTAELEAARSTGNYFIARIYNLDDESGASLRISKDIKDFAETLLASLDTLPAGVRVASVQLDPELLQWGPELLLQSAEDDD